MDVEGMRVLACDFVLDHVESVLNSLVVVDVCINKILTLLVRGKGQLQIADPVIGLEAAELINPRPSRREMV